MNLHRRLAFARVVILLEQRPQPPRLHTDDGVGLRIEGLRAPEHVDRDRVRLDRRLIAIKRAFDYIPKQLGELRRPRNSWPAEEFLQGRSDLRCAGRNFRHGRLPLLLPCKILSVLHVKRKRVTRTLPRVTFPHWTKT